MRIVLTGAAGGPGRLSKELRAAGFDVRECPLIRIEPIEGPPIRAADFGWLILTSARSIDPLLARLVGPLPRVAVVGPGTAEALRARGIEPSLVARRPSQEGLVRELHGVIGPDARILFAGAEGASDMLPQALGSDVVSLYRTVELRPPSFPAADLVLLASGSAARSLAALQVGLPCISIGPVTTKEAHRLGLRILAEAESPDPEGVLRAARLAESCL